MLSPKLEVWGPNLVLNSTWLHYLGFSVFTSVSFTNWCAGVWKVWLDLPFQSQWNILAGRFPQYQCLAPIDGGVASWLYGMRTCWNKAFDGPTGYLGFIANDWLICLKQQQEKSLQSFSDAHSFQSEAFSLILEEFSHLWMRCLHNWWRPRRLWLITWWNPLTTDVFKKGCTFSSKLFLYHAKCICSNLKMTGGTPEVRSDKDILKIS